MEKPTNIAILGASGYTGIELIRLVTSHPQLNLVGITSRTHAGKSLGTVFPRFAATRFAEVCFIEPDIDQVAALGVEAAFLALPHGKAAKYAKALLSHGIRVVDLSADFRLNERAVYEEFYGDHPAPELLTEAVYAMPELYAREIQSARLVASPGCYPTSIILPLVPLLREGIIDPSTIQAFCMSGVSGAGRQASVPLLYCEASNSVRAYGLPKHRHLSEIEQELSTAAAQAVTISFFPHLVPVYSGIASTISASLQGDLSSIQTIYGEAYGAEPFIRLLGEGVCADTKSVTRTNFLDLGWHYDQRTNRLVTTSAIDNLVKGASGQAIEALNLMLGYVRGAGLSSL